MVTIMALQLSSIVGRAIAVNGRVDLVLRELGELLRESKLVQSNNNSSSKS